MFIVTSVRTKISICQTSDESSCRRNH